MGGLTIVVIRQLGVRYWDLRGRGRGRTGSVEGNGFTMICKCETRIIAHECIREDGIRSEPRQE